MSADTHQAPGYFRDSVHNHFRRDCFAVDGFGEILFIPAAATFVFSDDTSYVGIGMILPGSGGNGVAVGMAPDTARRLAAQLIAAAHALDGGGALQ